MNARINETIIAAISLAASAYVVVSVINSDEALKERVHQQIVRLLDVTERALSTVEHVASLISSHKEDEKIASLSSAERQWHIVEKQMKQLPPNP